MRPLRGYPCGPEGLGRLGWLVVVLAFFLLSVAALIFPLISPLLRFRELKWLLVWLFTVPMCLPHLLLLASLYWDIPFFKGNGSGWDQIIWYFQTLFLVLLANGVVWVASWAVWSPAPDAATDAAKDCGTEQGRDQGREQGRE